MSSEMFSTLNPSPESRRRRGGAFACGLLAQGLLMGAAVVLGMVFPEELPVAAKQYVTIWLPVLRPPAEAVLKPPPPKVVRVVVPKIKLPETPEPNPPRVAQLVAPRTQPPISSASIHI